MTRLLVGFDGSPSSRRALDLATERARAAKGEILVVTVIPPSTRKSSLAHMMPAGVALPKPLEGTFEDHARERLDEVVDAARKAGAMAKADLRVGVPVEGILTAARDFQADEILLGVKSFEGPDAEQGPNATEVAARAKIPVTLVP
jgi:nucleotide-binding universal stress UspA family protein